MEHIAHAAPVVKWVGGKRQLLPQILPLIPKRMTAYCEPFLGGGAVLFALQPKRALVNDLNKDLITVYRVIKEDADALIEHLSRHENTPEYFYRIRDLDRDKEAYAALSDVEKASRLLYLNKTCYNGLFRVNASGAFNSPYGHYRRPNIVNEQTIRGVSRYFNACDITFFSGDFASVLEQVPKGGFVYLDPPYDPVSDTASFTGYNRGGFGREEQVRLKECCDALTARGVKFLLSNSATPFIRELYSSYRVSIVQARRAVNSVASRRGAIEEVLVRNYGTQ
ncbi:DNA adenine methylase [Pseudoflavonifractor sp.]|uniref:DNA adenine methylase n=1 Tax=Pseudoflavonifractor sp. TaxID=1980281 RepID=UPI003D913148